MRALAYLLLAVTCLFSSTVRADEDRQHFMRFQHQGEVKHGEGQWANN